MRQKILLILFLKHLKKKMKINNIFIKKYWVELALGIILFFSFLIRLYSLGKIGDMIFDEVYFVQFSRNYLTGTEFFDIHPPLGKLIMAATFKYLGDTSFTWRIGQAVVGTLLILLAYLTGKELKSKITGLLTALVLALDGMILVYSRVGLLDIYLSFFILLCFYLFLKYTKNQKIIYLILAGVALGLAGSIKYIGALVFVILILTAIIKKISIKENIGKYLVFLIIIPSVIYTSFFLFNFQGPDFYRQVIDWHSQSFNYNITLKETHPYGSKWWSWFLLLRPIWLYFKDIDGKLVGVDGMGNPLAWWSSIVIIPMLIWGTFQGYYNKQKDGPINLILLCGFLVFLLCWAPFNRVLFYYHALPSFLFLSLGIGYYLEKLSKINYGKYYLAIYILALAILFIYFLPIWIGVPLSSEAFYHKMWLKSWI